MSYLDRCACALDEHAEEMVETYLEAGRRGDWRALDALATRVLGRPTERVETTESTTELTRLTNLTEAQLLRLRAELEGNVPALRLTAEGQEGA